MVFAVRAFVFRIPCPVSAFAEKDANDGSDKAEEQNYSSEIHKKLARLQF